jgi:hypothetical protein
MEIKVKIYQARNGKIYICAGNMATALTEAQISELHLSIFDIDDLDFELYKQAYGK